MTVRRPLPRLPSIIRSHRPIISSPQHRRLSDSQSPTQSNSSRSYSCQSVNGRTQRLRWTSRNKIACSRRCVLPVRTVFSHPRPLVLISQTRPETPLPPTRAREPVLRPCPRVPRFPSRDGLGGPLPRLRGYRKNPRVCRRRMWFRRFAHRACPIVSRHPDVGCVTTLWSPVPVLTFL